MARSETVDHEYAEGLAVKGVLHLPDTAMGAATGQGLVFAHGAGGDRDSLLCQVIAEEFAASGIMSLRIDLPFRQRRPTGPPSPSRSPRDREGLIAAAGWLRERCPQGVFVGGQSYGGRQATIASAEEPAMADALLLTSYPLHPPGKPGRLRTEHFETLRTPIFFAHGTKDSFGSIVEMETALKGISSAKELLVVNGGGHGLVSKRQGVERLREVVRDVSDAFLAFVRRQA